MSPRELARTSISYYDPFLGDLPDERVSEKQNYVKRLHRKYFSLSEAQITCIFRPIPHPSEGRIAIVTDVGCGMRWTPWLRETNAAGADGEDVWSWHPDAGVKFVGRIHG